MAKTIIQFDSTTDIWPLVDQWAKKELLFSRETSLFEKEEPNTRTYVSGASGASLASARIRITQTGNSVRLEAWKSPLPLMEQPIDSFSLLGFLNPLLGLSKGSFNRLLTTLQQPPLEKKSAQKTPAKTSASGTAQTPKLTAKKWIYIGSAIAGIVLLGFIFFIILSNSVDLDVKDPFDRQPLATFMGEKTTPLLAIFSPDGKKLLTISPKYQSTVIEIWDASSAQLKGSIHTNLSMISKIAFNPDGHTLAMTDDMGGGKIFLADMDNPSSFSAMKSDKPQGGLGQYKTIGYDPSNSQLHTLFYDGTWSIFSADNGKIIKQENVGISDSAALSPDGGTLASTYYGTVKLSGKQTGTWKNMPGISNGIAFSPDGKTLAISSTGDVFLWHLDTGEKKQIPDIPVMDNVTDIKFNSDGTRLVLVGNKTIDNKGCLVVIDVKKNTLLRAYTELSGYRSALSFDLKRIALWDLKGFHLYDLAPYIK